MQANSLSYQSMEPWLLDPLMEGALTLAEATEMWDKYLLLGEPDRWTPDCPRLQRAAQRLNLWLNQELTTRH